MTAPVEENGLGRRLGLVSVSSIVVANIIGAGIFTTSGLLLADIGSPVVMIALWVVGGIIALSGALSYGELGAAIPQAGGEYAFLSRLYHPLLGFLSGWVSLFAGFSAPIAASAIGSAEYLTRAFPGLVGGAGSETTEAGLWMKKGIAILIIMLFTAIHRRGLEIGATVQNILTAMKIGIIGALICAGFSLGQGSFDHLSLGHVFTFDFAGFKTLGLSLMWVMFAYSGWNASAYIGSEIRDPERNLPRSLLLGTSLVIVLYLLLNLLYVYAITPEEMGGVISIGGLAAANLFGPAFETGFSIVISFAMFSSLSAFIILGPRVYYSMARDGCFPRFAGAVHSRFGVPSKSIILQGCIAALIVFVGRFDQILTYMGFSLGIFPILAVAGVFKLRRRGISAFRMPGFPVVPIFYILISSVILILAFLERPKESLIAIAMLILGIPFYFVFTSRGSG